MSGGTTVRHPRVGQFALWFSLLGGGLAWLLHLLLTYGLAEFGCVSGWPDFTFLGMTGLDWLLLGASALSIGLAGVSIWVSYRVEKYLEPFQTEGPDWPTPEHHVAKVGRVANLLFILIIFVQTIPIFFFLNEC